MDPKDVVDEMKELGASEDAIKARLERLGVSSSKQNKLLKGYKTESSHEERDTPYSFFLDYIPYWIAGIILLSGIILYFVNPELFVFILAYGLIGGIIVFPLTWVLRSMVNIYSRGYNRTYSGIKDYIVAIFIVICLRVLGVVGVLIAPLFSAIPILIVLIVLYDLTAQEAFLTTVVMVVTLLIIVFGLSYIPLLLGEWVLI